jgi:hypothetical protein
MIMKNFLFALFFTCSLAYAQAQSRLAAELWLQPQQINLAGVLPADLSACAPPAPSSAEKAIKSKGKAFMLSLLVPGMGERYSGRPQRAQFFLASEIALWLTFAGFRTFEGWRTQDYQSFAAAHAGVSPTGKDEWYFVNVGNYDSMEEYNAAKLRQRNLPAYYRDSATFYWKWPTPAEREKFEQLRLSAERADNHALFAVGAIVANHLISAIDAVWATHHFNKNHRTGVGFDFNLGCTPSQWVFSVSANLK